MVDMHLLVAAYALPHFRPVLSQAAAACISSSMPQHLRTCAEVGIEARARERVPHFWRRRHLFSFSVQEYLMDANRFCVKCQKVQKQFLDYLHV